MTMVVSSKYNGTSLPNVTRSVLSRLPFVGGDEVPFVSAPPSVSILVVLFTGAVVSLSCTREKTCWTCCKNSEQGRPSSL